MATIHLTARELREHDPKRFDKEYYEWCAYNPWDDWHDPIIDGLTERCEALGIAVSQRNVYYSGFHSQGDGLGFSGIAHMHHALERMGGKDRYLALWHALDDYGAVAQINTGGRHSNFISSVDAWYDFAPGNTYPAGIFKDLSHEAWDELVSEQAEEVFPELEAYLLEECRDLANDCYRELQDEYDAITSEDAFIESCEANEVTFEIEGEEA
jgi:hypothetical protein